MAIPTRPSSIATDYCLFYVVQVFCFRAAARSRSYVQLPNTDLLVYLSNHSTDFLIVYRHSDLGFNTTA